MADQPLTSPERTTPDPGREDELPDTRLFWRWVARSVRPYTGWLLVALGALAILAGYLGVSREALVAKQLPYLISGGIFGMALVAVGAYYLMTEDLRRDSGRLDRMERMVLELHAVLLARSDAPTADELRDAVRLIDVGSAALGATAGSNGSGARAGQPERLVALPDSQRFHREDCRMVQGKSGVEEVSPSVIRRRHLQPCSMCDPVVLVGA